MSITQMAVVELFHCGNERERQCSLQIG